MEVRYQKANCESCSGGRIFSYLDWIEQGRSKEDKEEIKPVSAFFRKIFLVCSA